MSENNQNLIKFGKKLKELREKRGFRAVSVAIGAKVTRQQMCEYEHGKRCMSLEKLNSISDSMFLMPDEKKELFELYKAAKKEAYKSFSKAAKTREEKKKNTWF